MVDSANPEALFGDLPKLPQRVAPLWGHQTDQLRTYFDKHKETADVALELPTGSGKTLVGMLIAEWRRRHLRQRTVYACPTVQLAKQAAEKAENQGIRVSLLIGGVKEWDSRLLHSYEAGDSIAVTTYSTIFNSNPKISDAQTLVFDDAHAAENYVAGAWSITVDREESLFDGIVEVLRPSLEKHLIARLSGSHGGSKGDTDVHLVPPSAVLRHEAELETAFRGALTEGPRKYALSMVSGQLAACCLYISGRSILIRPMVPPTLDHGAFSGAVQRIYLSATLGGSAEIERSFGRAKIARIPVPDEWNRSGGGRRFFVFPELADRTGEPGLSVGELVNRIMA
ncbi:DEAD/DEAH box helicase [Paenarthrobacter sp. Z7-10]|uniref:DEAD/DEAH box helicase n=1 Tax=Paenarthrobacter sp. Z7-10 TaxID=2787635 RepID=UPI0022A91FCF|nr:DEAD/DEAH box helicase [Paenarthrobacter sp. Z7-10]MCZ2404467.1 DEAD/DEAH box helicase [Paenarthrobacter sp. Z7-10]